MIKIGQQIGHFLVKSEIGRGGMGTIYYAVDTMLNRHVALKVIHPELSANPQLMERFKIEAMTQAQMNHPNVIMIFSFNKFDDDYVIAMEYVEGLSLKQILIDKSVLSIKEAISYLKQVLAGLEYAHSRHIIHRDIKPANIMISQNNQIKLSDFGIAKVFGREGLTKTGMLIGTPWYTSPEQILGKNVDFRSDLYSVGITFYEMLTGRVPFDSETNSEFQIQKAHLETPPPRPSIYNAEIGTKVEKFILKSLEKKSEKRFQTAMEMIAELLKIEDEFGKTAEMAPFSTIPGLKEKSKSSFSTLARIFLAVLIVSITVGFFVFKNKLFPPKKESNTILSEQAKAIEEVKKESTEAVSKSIDNKLTSKPKAVEISTETQLNEQRVDKNQSQEKTILTTPSKTQSDQVKKPAEVTPDKKEGIKKVQSVKENRVITNEPSVQEKAAVTSEQKKEIAPESIQGSASTPMINEEAELINIRNLLQDQMFVKAEESGAKLLAFSDSPRVLVANGYIKFLLAKYSECWNYWRKAIEKGGEIRLKFFHKHGLFDRGCSGDLILKKTMIIFDSQMRVDHSFALNRDSLVKINKIKNYYGINIVYKKGMATEKDTFIFFIKSDREKKEQLIVDFINQVILEGK